MTLGGLTYSYMGDKTGHGFVGGDVNFKPMGQNTLHLDVACV